VLFRNWYLAEQPGKGGPFDPRGFSATEAADRKGTVVVPAEEQARIEAELEHQVALIRAGAFPAQPRHDDGTCRSWNGGCPYTRWCDGEESVGAAIRVPRAAP
ncbi:MAG: hypothetical protein ACREN4_06635, partial [Candidatus Dormibacteria bacterium]